MSKIREILDYVTHHTQKPSTGVCDGWADGVILSKTGEKRKRTGKYAEAK